MKADTGVQDRRWGPEESDNFTIGTAFSIGNFDITLDYFNIAVDDRISISDQIDFVAVLEQTADNNSVPEDWRRDNQSAIESAGWSGCS